MNDKLIPKTNQFDQIILAINDIHIHALKIF